jgi:DMSO/TMAO reductase YedYZ molybdopterin-dependent catalytic subunit
MLRLGLRQQRPRDAGLSSNGRFTGVRLRDLLRRVGVGERAREVVVFGADRGNEDVVFRQQTFKSQQQFERSITLENAMKDEPLLGLLSSHRGHLRGSRGRDRRLTA